MNQTKRKLLSTVLAVAMVFQTAMPTVFAAETEESAAKTITGFTALEQTEYTLPMDADQDTIDHVLTFPKTITANVEYITTEEVVDSGVVDEEEVEIATDSDAADEIVDEDEIVADNEIGDEDEIVADDEIVDEDEIVADDELVDEEEIAEPVEESVEQAEFSITSNSAAPQEEMMTGFAAMKTAVSTLALDSDEDEIIDDPETTLVEKVVSEEVELAVTWQSNKNLTTDKAGEFVYTAVLNDTDKGRYDLAEGVSLPTIKVDVKEVTAVTLEGGVAQIGDTTYATLPDAVTAANANAGSTIKLLANVTKPGDQWLHQSTTLDLNGFTLDLDDGGLIQTAGVLTIQDTSEGAAGKITSSAPYQTIETHENVSVILNSGTVENTTGLYCILIASETATVNGGAILSTSGNGIGMNKPKARVVVTGGKITAKFTDILGYSANHAPADATAADDQYSVLITGGTLTSEEEYGVSVRNGSVKVTGGSITTNGAGQAAVHAKYALITGDDSNLTNTSGTALELTAELTAGGWGKVESGTISGANPVVLAQNPLTITGGTFSAKDNAVPELRLAPKGTGNKATISGGTFTNGLTLGESSGANTLTSVLAAGYCYHKDTATGDLVETSSFTASGDKPAVTVTGTVAVGTCPHSYASGVCKYCGKTAPITSVTINETSGIEYGDTITATVTGQQSGAVLSYKWLAGTTELQSGSSNTYRVQGADIGKTITVEVTASGYVDKLVSSATKTVQPKTVSATLGTISKVYDGSTDTETSDMYVSFQKVNPEDDITTLLMRCPYEDANVGIGKKINTDHYMFSNTGEAQGYYLYEKPLNLTGDITAKPLADSMMSGIAASYPYTGSPITPVPTVADGNPSIITTNDYTVSYEDNTNAGMAKVILTGKGNYSGRVEKTFTITKISNRPSSGGGSSSGGGGSTSDNGSTTVTIPPATTENPKPATEATTTVKPTVSNGTATVTVSESTVNDAITKAQAEAEKNGKTENGITITIQADTGSASNLNANLPKATVDALVKAGAKETNIQSGVATITLNLDTMKEIQKQTGTDVTVTATKVDNTTLSAEVKAVVGNRPVYDLSITGKNGVKVTDFGSGKVSVSIPYTLGANEKAGNVIAYYIDSTGKVQEMANSVYDPETETLSFVTEHFSLYAVGYKANAATTFTDITSHWAKESIEFVAARGLLNGTGNNKFSPDTSMTRGMFVTALGRLAGADVSSYTTSSFTDVKAGSYYLGYIEWASKNGIVNGTGNGKFAPDQSISREQLAVIMQNYAKAIGFELPKAHAENTFADNAKIGSYAKDAVKVMQMAGVLAGKNGNKFDPQGTATRAEVSAVLKRFVELVISTDNAQGWMMNDSGKWMFYENGRPVTGTKTIDGTSYTFDANGVTADVPKNLTYGTYTVQKGDSFWSISWKYKCSMFELARINDKSIFSILYIGDVLKVPEN